MNKGNNKGSNNTIPINIQNVERRAATTFRQAISSGMPPYQAAQSGGMEMAAQVAFNASLRGASPNSAAQEAFNAFQILNQNLHPNLRMPSSNQTTNIRQTTDFSNIDTSGSYVSLGEINPTIGNLPSGQQLSEGRAFLRQNYPQLPQQKQDELLKKASSRYQTNCNSYNPNNGFNQNPRGPGGGMGGGNGFGLSC